MSNKTAQRKEPGKIEGSIDAWESGELGRDEAYVEVASEEDSAIDDALELQMISIRLPKGLIEDLKAIASYHQMGYQPLIRNQLNRFADCELKHLARQYIESVQAEVEEKTKDNERTKKGRMRDCA